MCVGVGGGMGDPSGPQPIMHISGLPYPMPHIQGSVCPGTKRHFRAAQLGKRKWTSVNLTNANPQSAVNLCQWNAWIHSYDSMFIWYFRTPKLIILTSRIIRHCCYCLCHLNRQISILTAQEWRIIVAKFSTSDSFYGASRFHVCWHSPDCAGRRRIAQKTCGLRIQDHAIHRKFWETSDEYKLNNCELRTHPCFSPMQDSIGGDRKLSITRHCTSEWYFSIIDKQMPPMSYSSSLKKCFTRNCIEIPPIPYQTHCIINL